MSDNVENVRRGFAAFAEGDMDALREVLDPDVVWHEPGRSSISGEYRGIEATLGFFMQVFERSGGTFKAELLECGEIAPDLVACLVHVSASTPGGPLDQRGMNLFQQRSGRTIEAHSFNGDQYAADKAWG